MKSDRSQLVPQQKSGPDAEVEVWRAEVRDLRRAARARIPVERARGAVMARYSIDEDAALQLMARWSSVTDVPLRQVAVTVMELLTSSPERHAAEPDFTRNLTAALRALDPTPPR